jgi:membrane-bound lytic murein transglycosylase D
MKTNPPTDYWSLSLPEETTNYVPRLLAVAKIFANAEE